MQKIIIKHLVGSKSNQIDVFELPIEEIAFGRNNNCQVAYPENEAYVSGRHCKITVDTDGKFLLTDAGSSNGTFVNNEKITSQELQINDEVQLGQGEKSVKFVFDLDPRPTPKTKVIQSKQTEIFRASPTKTVQSTDEPTSEPSSSTATSKSAGIGKETAERLITSAVTRDRKKMINIGAMIIGGMGILGIGVGYLIPDHPGPNSMPPPPPPASSSLTPMDIHSKFGNSTVLIESSWKFIHIPTGKQIFQKVSCPPDEKGKCLNGKASLPWYIYLNGVIEPFLNFEGGNPIGGSGSGSGFVVTEGGHILTNRHVAAPWQANQSVELPLPGYLFVCNNAECSSPKIVDLPNDPRNEYVAELKKWVPANTKMFGLKPLHGKLVEGRHDYLDVTFPNMSLRLPARAGSTSGNADVALIKIDPTKNLEPVQMGFDDSVSPGESVTVMGYPGVSAENARKNGQGVWLTIPDPTVTPGSVGKVIADSASSGLASSLDDLDGAYQLTVNSTGSGNSGGPVFNDKGHVVGIFTALRVDANGTTISFAVPIKHAKEFM